MPAIKCDFTNSERLELLRAVRARLIEVHNASSVTAAKLNKLYEIERKLGGINNA